MHDDRCCSRNRSLSKFSDVRNIVDAAAKNGIPLMCGFVERFNPAMQTAIAAVREPIYASATRHSPYVRRIRTGVGADLLLHDVDLLLKVFRELPLGVSGSFGYLHPESLDGAEDVADCVLRFSSGAVGTASASRVAQRKIRSFVIYELDRHVEVDLIRNDVTFYRHVGNAAMDEATGLGYSQQTVIDIPVIANAPEPIASQLARFVDLVCGSADMDAERADILVPHEVLDRVHAVANEPRNQTRW